MNIRNIFPATKSSSLFRHNGVSCHATVSLEAVIYALTNERKNISAPAACPYPVFFFQSGDETKFNDPRFGSIQSLLDGIFYYAY